MFIVIVDPVCVCVCLSMFVCAFATLCVRGRVKVNKFFF